MLVNELSKVWIEKECHKHVGIYIKTNLFAIKQQVAPWHILNSKMNDILLICESTRQDVFISKDTLLRICF